MIVHVKINNLLSNRQCGFLRGSSSALQLLKVLDTWAEILDRGGELDVIYLDFMKAFDPFHINGSLANLDSMVCLER